MEAWALFTRCCLLLTFKSEWAELSIIPMANQDYSVRQLLEMAACTNCQICADVWPAVSASQDGELSGVYRMKGLTQILKSRTSLFRKLFLKKNLSNEQWQHFSNTVFRCTLCGNCQEICPVGIHLKDLWLSLRQDLVHSKFYPKKVEMIWPRCTRKRF